MSNLLWKSLIVSPAVLGATILVSGTAIASPSSSVEVAPETDVAQQPVILAQKLDQVQRYSNEGNNNIQSQVTSVSQFSDVQPTDWAFQALQSLVERYGCIAGYPNG
ncbi:MAG: hypothetical protein EAZ76_18775, partial [Nostocales cyanobacterium]